MNAYRVGLLIKWTNGIVHHDWSYDVWCAPTAEEAIIRAKESQTDCDIHGAVAELIEGDE